MSAFAVTAFANCVGIGVIVVLGYGRRHVGAGLVVVAVGIARGERARGGGEALQLLGDLAGGGEVDSLRAKYESPIMTTSLPFAGHAEPSTVTTTPPESTPFSPPPDELPLLPVGRSNRSNRGSRRRRSRSCRSRRCRGCRRCCLAGVGAVAPLQATMTMDTNARPTVERRRPRRADCKFIG